MFQSIGSVSPILSQFQVLFSESSALRESLSEFYAIVVEFCAESLKFLKKSCKFYVPILTSSTRVCLFSINNPFNSNPAVWQALGQQSFRFFGVRVTVT